MATKKVARKSARGNRAEFESVSAELGELVLEFVYAWDARAENPEVFIGSLTRLANARLHLDDVTSREFGGAS